MRRLTCGLTVFLPALLDGETLTLQQAIQKAEANNRAIRAAVLERSKAQNELNVTRSYRLPVFSLTALGSQSLARLGLTFPQGSLGVYSNVGPIPGKTTTLAGPLQPGGILYASVAQPLSQQHKVGLGIQLARVGVDTADESIRSKRQLTVNEVRRLYYGILQSESARKSLKATIEFLNQLEGYREHPLTTGRASSGFFGRQGATCSSRVCIAQARRSP
jgi:outer membrane protein TolC